MGRKTKIDWCDASWNPVTGCLHGCAYCYADRMAKRFAGKVDTGDERIHVMEGPIFRGDGTVNPYPYGFDPTFHRYRLNDPELWKRPKNIFVCSMADLFGEWVPELWINSVLNTCRVANWHRYLFLTKNPKRYPLLALRGLLPIGENFWYGSSTPRVADGAFWSQPQLTGKKKYYHTFVSIEPMLERFGRGTDHGTVALTDWVIVGAETGNRKDRVKPEKEWIMEIAEECRERGKPIFMKESLRELMSGDFKQEFPW